MTATHKPTFVLALFGVLGTVCDLDAMNNQLQTHQRSGTPPTAPIQPMEAGQGTRWQTPSAIQPLTTVALSALREDAPVLEFALKDALQEAYGAGKARRG